MPHNAVTLLVNPNAGGLLDGAVTPEDIAARIADAGFQVDLMSGPPAGLRERLERAVALPADLIVVAGGDGTINTAAQVLAGTGKTLAMIPAGTLNHLTKDLGIPGDIDGAVEVLRTGEPGLIDIGEVNGNLFLCSSVIGFASRIGGQRERWRGQLNPWTWLRLFSRIARTLYRDPRLDVRLSGSRQTSLRTRYLMVSVGVYDEAPGQLLTRSSLDSGRFGVYAVRRPTLVRLLRLFVAILAGRWRRMPDLVATDATTVEVSCGRPRLRVMNDGEVRLVETPLRYRLHAGALRILKPRAVADEVPPRPAAGDTAA